jgi:outer membrane protein assembly factor BamD (BamD/ComL family)
VRAQDEAANAKLYEEATNALNNQDYKKTEELYSQLATRTPTDARSFYGAPFAESPEQTGAM